MSSNAKSTQRKGTFSSTNGGKEHFSVIYDAFRAAFPRYAKGYDPLKILNRVGKKLESISEPTPSDKDEFRRSLREGDQILLLDNVDWEKLKAMVADEEIPWSHHAGEKAVAAIEFIRGWEEVTVTEEAKK